jgi:hypothetical protein
MSERAAASSGAPPDYFRLPAAFRDVGRIYLAITANLAVCQPPILRRLDWRSAGAFIPE